MKHFEKDGCKIEKRDFILNGGKVKRNYCCTHDVFVCDRCNGSFADHYSGGMWACAFNPSENTERNSQKAIHQEYLEYFKKMTDAELICEFNRLHADNGWIGRKIICLGALQDELKRRNIKPANKPIK